MAESSTLGLTNTLQLQWTGDPEAPPREEVDDIQFINILLKQIVGDYNVDKDSIYVAGFSNGGGLAGLLACDSAVSCRIAAFAASSGAFYKDEALKEPFFSHCHLSRQPIPFLEFHGDKDPVIHYDGKTTPDGPTYDIFGWIQGWAYRNGCSKGDKGIRTLLHAGRVEKTVWTCGGVENVVEHYKIAGFAGQPHSR